MASQAIKTYANVIRERIDQIKDIKRRVDSGENVSLFIKTGLRDWDAKGGIGRGILTVIGGGTGDGKSMVKLHLAQNAARNGLRVLMIDLEDPAKRTADRSLSSVTGIDNKRLETLELDTFDLDCIEAAYSRLAEWAHLIDHVENGQTTSQVLSLIGQHPYDLILIDYATAFPEDPGKNMERTIADFAYACNEHAKTTNSAVVIFSQLGRQVEARGFEQLQRRRFREPDSFDITGFRPSGKTDVAWAQELGQKAKALLYVHNPGARARLIGAKNIKIDRIMIIEAKNNFGPETDMLFEFDGATATIRDLPQKRD